MLRRIPLSSVCGLLLLKKCGSFGKSDGNVVGGGGGGDSGGGEEGIGGGGGGGGKKAVGKVKPGLNMLPPKKEEGAEKVDFDCVGVAAALEGFRRTGGGSGINTGGGFGISVEGGSGTVCRGGVGMLDTFELAASAFP